MISTKEALQLVMDTVQYFGVESVGLEESIGRVLGEDIVADRAFPPFDRVTMDGIAISYESWNSGMRSFDIENLAPAGSKQTTLVNKQKCIEVMTGAVCPLNCDTIIRYEDLKQEGNSFIIEVEQIKAGQNIHIKGSDHPKDSVLLKKGHKIKAIDINILATVGRSKVNVIKRPNVAILSSGDELVTVETIPEAHQIRMSNVHMLIARLKELGVSCDHLHINDDKAEIENSLSRLIDKYDVILMSGGVSKGKFDFIPEVLEKLGVLGF